MTYLIIEGDPGQLRSLTDELAERNYLPEELNVSLVDDTKLTAAEALAEASEEEILPLLQAFLSNLQAVELDEVGYCPACGEDYCRNHELQYRLINVIPGVEEILCQYREAGNIQRSETCIAE